MRKTIPYNPEENGITERVDRTIMDGVRFVLFTANMEMTYLEFTACDVAFKQSLLTHSAMGQCLYAE